MHGCEGGLFFGSEQTVGMKVTVHLPSFVNQLVMSWVNLKLGGFFLV